MACVKLFHLSQNYLTFLVLIFLDEVSAQFAVSRIQINSCSKNNLIDVKDINITVTEHSVEVLSGMITLTERLKSPIQADVKLSKRGRFLGIWITLPCFNKYLGSCHYEDLCQLLEILRASGISKSSECPILPMSINLSGVKVDVGSHLQRYRGLIPGDYKVLVKLYQDSNTVSCFDVTFNIKES